MVTRPVAGDFAGRHVVCAEICSIGGVYRIGFSVVLLSPIFWFIVVGFTTVILLRL